MSFAILRNRNMAILLAGRVVSISGDWVYSVALSVAIYQFSHHKSYYIGLFWMIRLIAGLAFGPLAGVVAARLGYRRTMIVADIGRFVLVTALALLLQPATWAAVYPIAFGIVALSSLFNPSSVGLVPSLLASPDQRLSANATIMQISSLAVVIGSGIGGAAVSIGFTPLLLLDAGSFLVSAGTLLFIRPRPAVVATASTDVEGEPDTGFTAGIRILRGRPLLLFAVAVMVLPEFASGAGVIWFIPMSEQVLHLGGHGVGYLYGALGVGAVLGGVVAAALGTTIRLQLLLTLSVAGVGLAFAVFGLVPIALIALLFVLLIGLFEAIEYAAYETLVQQAVPERLIAHAFGTLDSFLTAIVLMGNLVSGFLVLWIGVQASVAGLGVVTILGAATSWGYLRGQTAGKPTAAALTQVPAFAHVSGAMREWAVRRMTREEFPAGAVIIQQGSVGDCFYTIAGGSAEAEVDGVVQRILERGDFFGEIALLHQVPRTASVRAVAPMVVWTLSRDDFDQLRTQASEFGESLMQVAAARLDADAGRAGLLQPSAT